MVLSEYNLCLDLCELVLPEFDGTCAAGYLNRRAASAIRWARGSSVQSEEALSQITRVYVGSSFCPNVFLALSANQMRMVAEACAQRGIGVTLTVPTAGQAQLEGVNGHMDELMQAAQGVLDELTVNDYGAFVRWGAVAADSGFGLNLGRLMQKDLRDPRDARYMTLRSAPAVLQRDWLGWSNFDRLVQTQPVSGVEFDAVHEVLELSTVPEGVMAAVHGPLCCMSTGRICEFASIGVAVEKKFHPDAPCALQCRNTAIRYRGASGCEFWKVGRSVFFRAERPQVVGVDRYRLLFAPVSLLTHADADMRALREGC